MKVVGGGRGATGGSRLVGSGVRRGGGGGQGAPVKTTSLYCCEEEFGSRVCFMTRVALHQKDRT